ncbi:hypothetical protein QJ48_07530 [Paenibacillus sp. A3]|uniref:hypothetical protein n=1 Tax=Paenibacillus sp. A3 TaxID=1337054 RepID=UPI0006D53075|nr:hypothetical protein [Paenibacillus sp. A3]KPV60091.1 hypothetical protein QJ48_07530 [Paenibacillus sp. A3]
MKLKKLLSTLLIGASMMVLAQSALAATQPIVSPVSKPQVEAKSLAALGNNMWFQINNLGSGQSTTTFNFAKYVSYGGHYANLTISQKTTDPSEGRSPVVFYAIFKENSSWTSPMFTLNGNTSQTHLVYLEPGTYFVLVENRGNVTVDVHGILGSN